MKDDQSAKVLRIIWIAFLASLGLYTAVVLVVSGTPAPQPNIVAILRPVLASLAVVLAAAGFFVRRRVCAPGGPVMMTSDGGSSGEAAAQRLRVGCIVTWALAESVGVLGLVLGLLTREPWDFAPFVVAAGFLLYWHRPSVWQQDGISQGMP